MGVPEANAFVIEDGDVLELTQDSGAVVDKVQAGHMFVDGHRLWGAHAEVLGERVHLARNGIVVVVATMDKKTRALLKTPEAVSAGFAGVENSDDLMQRASEEAQIALERAEQDRLDLGQAKGAVVEAVSKFLYDETRRRPTVLANINEV